MQNNIKFYVYLNYLIMEITLIIVILFCFTVNVRAYFRQRVKEHKFIKLCPLSVKDSSVNLKAMQEV